MNNTHLLATIIISSPFMMTLLAVFLFLIFGFFVLVAVIIRLNVRLRYITYPVYDQIVKKAQSKANDIINDAQTHAQSIRISAQETAEKIISDRKDENEKFREEYTKHFEEIVAHGKDVLTNQSAELTKLSQKMVDEFKEQSIAANVLVHKKSELISNTLSEESEQIKQSFAEMNIRTAKEQCILIEEIKKNVSEEIAKEISIARDAITAYKKERFNLLDREIVELVKETARIALNKTLSLREHRDQILIALKEAKQNGIFDK